MPKQKCSKCKRKYTVTPEDLEPLTVTEWAICAKEGMSDIENFVGIRCPHCGARTLMLAPAGMRPAGGGDRTVTVNGREYKVLQSADQLGRMFARGQGAASVVPWKEVCEQHIAVSDANSAAGGRKVALENVLVACTSCSWRLNSNGLSMLVMFSMPNVSMGGVATSAGDLRKLLDGHCPQCGKDECYYIMDSAGFAKS